jgi:tetratricopeptide (TPR) repeat protein
MTRKAKSSRKKKVQSTYTPVSQALQWVVKVQEQLLQEDYEGAIKDGERLLSYLPTHARERVNVLLFLVVAYTSLGEHARVYDLCEEAVKLAPNDADVWYNHGLASRSTSRFSQSLRDFEHAARLDTGPMKKQIKKELELAQKLVNTAIKLRGPHFTPEQYAEQEALYHQGLACMHACKWTKAVEAFRATIAMGDCLPQPHANLGICLMMQKRYDEAEEEFKCALAIDPNYQVAKQNLGALPETRRNGPPDVIAWTEPFAGKTKVSSTKLLN